MAKSSKRRKVARLLEAAHSSYKSLDRMRQYDLKVKMEFMGDHFNNGARPLAVNLINDSIITLVANLASESPKAEIDARTEPAFAAAGRIMSKIISDDMRRMNYRRTAQITLINALTGVGVVKIGRGPGPVGYTDADGRHISGLVEYIDSISPHAWVTDTECGRRDDRVFEGHGYTTSLRYLRENRLITEEAAGRFQNGAADLSRHSGREREEKSGNVVRPSGFTSTRDVVKHVDLVDLWVAPGVLGREPMYIIVPGRLSTGEFDDPIEIREWTDDDGPPDGPYEIESFYPTPDNAIDTAPAPFWLRMARMTNAMIENAIDGDMTIANIAIVDESMNEERAAALMSPKNGRVYYGNAGLVNRLTVGGAAPEMPQKIAMYRQLFADQAFSADKVSGDTIIGQSGSRTATEVQDRSIKTGAKVGFLEEQHYDFQDRVVRKYFWLKRRSPLLREVSFETVAPGIKLPIEINAQYFEDVQDIDLQFSVERGSMKRATIEQRAQKAMQSASVIVPLAANLAVDPNFNSQAFVTSMLKQLVDEDEIRTWYRDQATASNTNQPRSEPAETGPTETVPMPPGGAFSQPGTQAASVPGGAALQSLSALQQTQGQQPQQPFA